MIVPLLSFLIAGAAPEPPADPWGAAAPERQCSGRVCVEVEDQVPRFLAFWDAAQAHPPADADARFALWKEKYGFAAVPPGPRGQEMARRLLDQAWARYPAAVAALRTRGTPDPAPLDSLARVARLLDFDQPLTVKVVYFVGGFEGNAFAYAMGDMPVVNFPVEAGTNRAVEQAHELTHAVHTRLAGLSGGWERSIAQTLLQEGLAMHVSREAVPGLPVAAYVTHKPEWWAAAQARKAAILADVMASLEAKDGASVYRQTIGQGASGLTRQAYAAGWWVVEDMRAHGMTLAQIARIPPERIIPAVRKSMVRISSSAS